MNKFRKIIEKQVTVKLGALKKPDGNTTEPGIDTLQHQADTHFQAAEALKSTSYNSRNSACKEKVMKWNPTWMNMDQIQIALNQFREIRNGKLHKITEANNKRQIKLISQGHRALPC